MLHRPKLGSLTKNNRLCHSGDYSRFKDRIEIDDGDTQREDSQLFRNAFQRTAVKIPFEDTAVFIPRIAGCARLIFLSAHAVARGTV